MKCLRQDGVWIKIIQRNRTSHFQINEISYISCNAEISTIHFNKKRKPIIVSKLLKLFEEELVIYGFIRINRNTLVNITSVQELMRDDSKQFLVLENEKMVISRRRFTKIRELLSSFNDHSLDKYYHLLDKQYHSLDNSTI